MATLYWGGGTGTWDGFTTGKWYTDLARTTLSTRAPTADDDVIFDSSSNATAYTVTISGTGGTAPSCKSLTVSGPASGNVSIAGSGSLYVYGSLTLSATGVARSYTGAIWFYGSGSQTITTNGITLNSSVTFAGSGTYTLQDALNLSSGQLFLDNGTLNTNDKTLTCGNITSNSTTSTATLTLGASTVSAVSIQADAPITINGGTSNITLSASSPCNIGGGTNYTGNTFYNVTFSNGAPTINIYGNNTFNNLTFTTMGVAAFVSPVTIFGNQTINGTLTISGGDSIARYFVRSDTTGTARTLTVASVSSLTDIDFRDITVSGSSAPWSGTRLGDCLGNSGITFAAGTNKYITAGAASSNWSANIWATSSGGSANIANFPLAQDTVIIDNAGLGSGNTLTTNRPYNIGGIDASSRTNAMTISTGGQSPTIHGNLNAPSAVNGPTSGSFTFAGRTTQTINCVNSWCGFTVNSPGGTVSLSRAFSCGGFPITLVSGTFDLNNYNLTLDTLQATGNQTKTLTLGSGTVSASGGIGSTTSISNLTVTANTATISISTSGARLGFVGVSSSFGGTITISSGTTGVVVYGDTTVGNLTLGSVGTTPSVTSKLQLRANLTVTGTLNFTGGASAVRRILIASDIPGTQRTLTVDTASNLTDIDFRDIAAAGTSAPWSGTRLGNCGGNSSITFDAAKTVYWNLSGTQNWSATGWATTSGGTPDINNFPLAQDTAVFDDTGAAGTVTINAAWNIGTIDMSGRTSAMTLAGFQSPIIYGSITYGSGITSNHTGIFYFQGTTTQTLTTAGKSLQSSIQINNPSCVFQHGDAFTATSSSIQVNYGSYNTQNYNISVLSFASSNTNTRSITFGTSTLTLSGQTPFNISTTTNLTFSGASSTINLSNTSTKSFQGGGQTFGTLSSTGGTTSPLTITGSNTFTTLTNSARTYLILTSGTTQTVTTFTYTGASGSVVRLYTSIPGQRATINNLGTALGFGSNSTDGGNNTDVVLTGTNPNYLYIKDIIYLGLIPVISGGNFLMFFI